MSDEFCTKCGAKIPEDANFCPKCGAKKASIRRKSKQKDVPILMIVITFIIIALLCGLLIFMLMTRDMGIKFDIENQKMVKEDLITPTIYEVPSVSPSTDVISSPSPTPAITPSPTAVPETENTYKNTRYGFSIKYPANIFTSYEYSQNGDGVTLSGKNITASVYGSNNVFHKSLDELYADALKSYPNVEYKVKKTNCYVVSGTDNGTIYYVREYVGSQSINTLIIRYPASMEKSFDKTVTTLSNSLAPGNLSEAH